MLIEPLPVAPGAPAVLQWRRPGAPKAPGIDASWGQGAERFEPDSACPGGAKVLHVSEPLAALQAQVPQQDVMRRGPTATVLSPMDRETRQMLVTPGKQALQEGLEMRQGGRAGHQHVTPDEGAHAAQDDAEWVEAEWCHSDRHALRVAQSIRPLQGSPRYLALSTMSRRDQKAEKHADCRHHGLRVANAMTPGPVEDKVTQCSRLIPRRLIPKRC
jgi:hypothetical protein